MSLHIIPQSDYPPKYYIEVCRHDYGEDSGYRVTTISVPCDPSPADDAHIGRAVRCAITQHQAERS